MRLELVAEHYRCPACSGIRTMTPEEATKHLAENHTINSEESLSRVKVNALYRPNDTTIEVWQLNYPGLVIYQTRVFRARP